MPASARRSSLPSCPSAVTDSPLRSFAPNSRGDLALPARTLRRGGEAISAEERAFETQAIRARATRVALLARVLAHFKSDRRGDATKGRKHGRERTRLEADREFRDVYLRRELLPAEEAPTVLGEEIRAPFSREINRTESELRRGEKKRREGDAKRGRGGISSGTNRGTSLQRIERASGEF